MSSENREKALNQLEDFRQKQKKEPESLLTTSTGAPIGHKTSTLSAGPRGPLLLQDHIFLDEMAHFDRERIPERVVHAKGAGAFGHFEVTHDITDLCKANVFSSVGKKTPVFVRFSTVGGESGSADTVRDPRGFAVKFYTEEGNWDLVGNNTPIFFLRDPILFPSFIHTQKRNPVTHLKDPDMFWDFISLRPETCHQVAFLFSDRGTPYGYRHMNGYGSHTFKMVNESGEACYVKFHLKTDQGIKNFDAKEADDMTRDDPDFSIRDLYNAIADENFPSWTMHVQVMSLKEAKSCPYDPFDLTKIWPHGDFPLRQVGKLVLNRNPKNYFAEVEQSAFSPANLVPGIEASPDKMLQGRMFSYGDTHRHRLGANFQQIPVNCPYRCSVRNYQRDGPMTIDGNQGGAPNYFPNSFSGPTDKKTFVESSIEASTEGARFDSSDEGNYGQLGLFIRNVLDEAARGRLVDNMASHLCHAQKFIRDRVIQNFSVADENLGKMLAQKVDALAKK